MDTVLRQPATLAEFLAWEERQPLRYEFDGVRPVAMTGGTIAHNRLMRRLLRLLEDALAASACEVFGPDVKIIVDGKARYPDAVVSCTPQSNRAQVLENPVVVFEVLSDSTSRTDRVEKVREYQATASIQQYVLLEQDRVRVTTFERDVECWVEHVLETADRLILPAIGAEIAMQELYAGSGILPPA